MKLKILVIFLFISKIGFSGDISSETDFVNDDYTMLEAIEENTTMVSTLIPEDEVMEEEMMEEDNTHIGLYVGGGLSIIGIEEEDKVNFFEQVDTQDRQLGVNLLVGYDVIDNLAIEARALFGIANEKDTKLQNYALFAKPNIDVIKNLNLYGLLGYAYTNLADDPKTDNDSGVTWGGGLSYNFKDLIGGYEVVLYSDMLNLLHKDKTFSMGAFNFGAMYLF